MLCLSHPKSTRVVQHVNAKSWNQISQSMIGAALIRRAVFVTGVLLNLPELQRLGLFEGVPGEPAPGEHSFRETFEYTANLVSCRSS